MQLTCPHCGEPVLAENINIQRMVAVCAACHQVFQFDPADSAAKIKQRKVKPPQHTTSTEIDGEASIAFRTNFRLDSNEAFILSVIVSGILTFITLVMAAAGVATRAPVFPLMFGFFAVLAYYTIALQVFNKTHIEINDEQIKVSRKPLPNIFSQGNTISLSGVELIRYEETAVSKKEGYDTPRYNVWAEMVDGERKIVLGDVIGDYAVFVTQWLNEKLNPDAAPDVTNLIEPDEEDNETQSPDEFVTPSKSLRH